jgi:NAD(P)-dependent dehydrogenase (short-subunit alcohol dehydrogenase family)
VYVAARNQEKASAAIERLQSLTGKSAIFLKLDLADLKVVKAAAEEFLRYSIACSVRSCEMVIDADSKEKELHILFNNGSGLVMLYETC